MTKVIKPDILSREEVERRLSHFDRPIEEYSLPTQYERQALQTALHYMEREERLRNRRVVCLCGSTRFTDEMLVIQWDMTKRGCVVLSWCALPDSYFASEDKTHIGDQEDVKEIVDEVHKRKIDLCTEVFVVSVGGYIGESTASEIHYARSIGKPVTYLEPLTEESQARLEALAQDQTEKLQAEEG